MRLKEANRLQTLVAETHPLLDVQIKKVEAHNDAWACYIEVGSTQWYMWSASDWFTFKAANLKRLEVFTEEGKKRAVSKWKASRAANLARKREALTA